MAAATRSRKPGASTPSSSRDSLPQSKKAKITKNTPKTTPNGFKALLNGSQSKGSPLAAKLNNTKHARKAHVDEAAAVVSTGAGHGDVDMTEAKEIIEISSSEEDSDDSDDDEAVEAGMAAASNVNGISSHGHETMEEGTVEPEELSFGEQLKAQEPDVAIPEVIDVEAAFAAANPEITAVAAPSKKKALGPPSASSLGTVLTQALRTNDKDLLDSCLRVIDVDTIYATVERLPSPLVGNLLQKLAERLHKRPGRAGMLMIWIQWSLAAHGGYLAMQPQLVKQLSTLNVVLKERASGLQPLLSLKGRLDMLHAQLELRRRNQKRTIEDEEGEAVIYVEGDDDNSSEEEQEEKAEKHPRKRTKRDEDSDDESSEDDMPTTMAYYEEDESEEGSEDEEGLLDDEAEETSDDEGDDLSDPELESEDEGGEDASASEEESKEFRRSTAGRAGMARRR